MIENEHELQAARDWLRYWKSIVADGEQSWLGGENARCEVMRYARAISLYEHQQADRRGEPAVDEGSPASQAHNSTANT
jgi:hypothetical protein